MAVDIETGLRLTTGPAVVATPSVVEHALQPDRPVRAVDLSRWVAGLFVLDFICAGIGAVAGRTARFGDTSGSVLGISYTAVAIALPVAWLVTLWAAGAYRQRHLAAGHEEFGRVVNAGVWLVAIVAFVSFALHANLSRGFVAVAMPLVVSLTLVERYAVRKRLHRLFREGHAIHRAVVVGSAPAVSALIEHMRRAPHAGFSVVGVVITHGIGFDLDLPGIIVLDTSIETLPSAVAEQQADTIAVAGGDALTGPALRRLSWNLEGTGIQLVVAPALTDIAGPRIVVRPVDGLPLLHVDEPEFSGGRRLMKEIIERVLALMLLLVLSPVLLGIAVAIRLGSRGPVLFRQVRVGQHGTEFTLVKFRTMYEGADAERETITHLNENEVLFKVRRDPRITPVGRLLRRHSLDELPQLWNVVTGSMSLVGPRPPLRDEVDRYGEDVRRRLLVKPGMTGLWQVSGRADLSWEESVRLDLHYVENWSVALDALVLWKTMAAVIHGRGAY
jgi:exopolysaccharide biosynthesis polyprenyl glycosylphosphotransferase